MNNSFTRGFLQFPTSFYMLVIITQMRFVRAIKYMYTMCNQDFHLTDKWWVIQNYISISCFKILYIYIYIFTTTLIAKRKHFHFFLRRFTIHLKYKHYFMNVLKRKIFVLFPQATKVINFLKITNKFNRIFFTFQSGSEYKRSSLN